MRPETKSAKSNEGYVAYQVFGDGPRDLLFVTNWATNLDAMWEEPSLAYYFHRLGRFGRVICFDKRGTGVSDPVPLGSLPTLEEWMDDAMTVLEAVDSEQAAIIGDTEGGPMAMLLAATYPDRALALILLNTFARWQRAPDYPIGMPESTMERLLTRYERHWGPVWTKFEPAVSEGPTSLLPGERDENECSDRSPQSSRVAKMTDVFHWHFRLSHPIGPEKSGSLHYLRFSVALTWLQYISAPWKSCSVPS